MQPPKNDKGQITGKSLREKALALSKLRTIDEKLLVDFLSVGSIALGALSGNGIAKGAASLAEGLVPGAVSFAYNTIKSKVFGGSFLEATG